MTDAHENVMTNLFGRAYLIKHTIYGRLSNMASENCNNGNRTANHKDQYFTQSVVLKRDRKFCHIMGYN